MISERVLAPGVRGGEDLQLHDEAGGGGHAGLREQEEGEQATEQRPLDRETLVVIEGVEVVTAPAGDRDHRERADGHERVHEQVEQRRFTARGVATWNPMRMYPACAIDEYARTRLTSVWMTAAMLPTASVSAASAHTAGRQSSL